MGKRVEIEDSIYINSVGDDVHFHAVITLTLDEAGPEVGVDSSQILLIDAEFSKVHQIDFETKEIIDLVLTEIQRKELIKILGRQANDRFSVYFPSRQAFEDERAEANFDKWNDERDERGM